jgi:hypothetical protein
MKLIEQIDLEPDIRLCGHHSRPIEDGTVQRILERLKIARDDHGREAAYRNSGLPPLTLNAHRELVNGRHRQQACALADVPPVCNVYRFDDHIEEQLQVILENLARTKLSAEQEREELRAMVLLTEQRIDECVTWPPKVSA